MARQIAKGIIKEDDREQALERITLRQISKRSAIAISSSNPRPRTKR